MSDNNSKNTQLDILNTRARAYTTRIWQIPFAYLGLTGILISSLIDKDDFVLILSIIFSILFGVLVFLNMCGMYSMLKKTIDDIKDCEEKLGFDKTVVNKPVLNIYPLFGLIILSWLIYGGGLIYIVCKICSSN